MKKLQIDVVSDLVCPWCIIGYSQLVRALEMLGDKVETDIVWHPYILKPNAPIEGVNHRTHLKEKYQLDDAQVDANYDELMKAGEKVGFKFNYHPEFKTYNTSKAHELLHYAAEKGKQTELKVRLFYAYYNEEKNIGLTDVLVTEAEAVGLDKTECLAILADGRYTDVVLSEAKKWKEKGVKGIPTYFVNEHKIEGSSENENILAETLLSLAK